MSNGFFDLKIISQPVCFVNKTESFLCLDIEKTRLLCYIFRDADFKGGGYMKIKELFSSLTKFEKCLWATSLIIVTVSYLLAPSRDILSLVASLIGVTALIFVSKGYVFGQLLCVFFSVFYGIISFIFGYYGEMITYLFMATPIAILAVVSWIRNPYKETKVVTVRKMRKREWALVLLLAIPVTVIFYFILKYFNTVNLIFSTISITTSFIASFLTFMRNPYYAVAYALNDIVLIILWSLATAVNIAYLPMVACFLMFLANDIYGFINWSRLQKDQNT